MFLIHMYKYSSQHAGPVISVQKTNDAELSGSYAYCSLTYVYTCSLETKTSSLLHFPGPFPHVLLIYPLPENLIASRYSEKPQET